MECRQDGALVGALVGGAQTRLAQTHGFGQYGAQATMNLLVNKHYCNTTSQYGIACMYPVNRPKNLL